MTSKYTEEAVDLRERGEAAYAASALEASPIYVFAWYKQCISKYMQYIFWREAFRYTYMLGVNSIYQSIYSTHNCGRLRTPRPRSSHPPYTHTLGLNSIYQSMHSIYTGGWLRTPRPRSRHPHLGTSQSLFRFTLFQALVLCLK